MKNENLPGYQDYDLYKKIFAVVYNSNRSKRRTQRKYNTKIDKVNILQTFTVSWTKNAFLKNCYNYKNARPIKWNLGNLKLVWKKIRQDPNLYEKLFGIMLDAE